MARSADVVIIGGAVVGSSIAYFLKRSGFAGSVVVVEKDPSYQHCATGRSVASIRQQFTTEENIRLSQFGLALFRGIKEEFGPEADVSFRERGYLIMATAEGRANLEQAIALQRRLGADTELLEPGEMRRRFPWMSVEGLAAAGWGRTGEGWVDPHALMTLFRNGARARGAAYEHDEAIGIDMRGGRAAGVRLRSGAAIAAGTVVIAAGWHSAKVAAMAGVDLPVRPKKRLVFVVDCREPLPGAGLMIDPSGLYFRPEGKFFLTGIQPPEDADPDTEDFEIDHAFFDSEVWPRLAHRVPAFEAVKVTNAWACHYDYNLLDQNAILGPHPEIGNLLLACGFSGHGLQHSPAVGRALAEMVIHGRSTSINVDRLGFGRILTGAAVRELNVY